MPLPINPKFKINYHKSDPYSSYNFLVEIEGIIAAGFTEVSGLKIETEVESVTEGGANDIVYKIPKGTKYTDITLKHGLSDSAILWNWYKKVINGNIQRKNGTIILLDHKRNDKLRWEFIAAYPISWEVSSFNALTNTVAIETLVLTHQGINKI